MQPAGGKGTRAQHAENANRMTETAANAERQHGEELESTAASAAARTEQPEASGTTAADMRQEDATTTTQGLNNVRGCVLDHAWCITGRFGALAREPADLFTPRCVASSIHTPKMGFPRNRGRGISK